METENPRRRTIDRDRMPFDESAMLVDRPDATLPEAAMTAMSGHGDAIFCLSTPE
jgi:hypothetical protein